MLLKEASKLTSEGRGDFNRGILFSGESYSNIRFGMVLPVAPAKEKNSALRV